MNAECRTIAENRNIDIVLGKPHGFYYCSEGEEAAADNGSNMAAG
jgi:hypothetical protein